MNNLCKEDSLCTTGQNVKRAIIMGATSGIGLEVARILAADGWQLGLAGRRIAVLEELKKNCPQIKAVRKIDITAIDAAERLEELIDELGGMELYFHSSGIGWQNMELDAERELQTAETNVVGFIRMITVAWHYFRLHPDVHGHVAVISSIAGTHGLGAAPAYSATKRFQSQYIESLSQLSAMQGQNITFTEIRPGFVTTDLIKGSNYPMQLQADDVAREIVKALKKRKSVITIDWRYDLLVFFWRLIPRWLWVRMKIK